MPPLSEEVIPTGHHPRTAKLRIFELLVVLPLLLLFAHSFSVNPDQFLDPRILIWALAVAVVDLLPVKASSEMAFSLSFPIELSAALVYSPAVAALTAFLGAADRRELKGELPLPKALYIRGQIAWSVAIESFVFHHLASLDHWRWFQLGPAVLAAAIAGYAVNVIVVAKYASMQTNQPLIPVIRQMHVGVFGEFVVSYMGLALFSVLVALSTQSTRLGLWALIVFIAPLAFARQMFTRTHSLQVATDELAERQAENEHQALHDALTGMPNRMLFQQQLGEAIYEAKERSGSVAVMLMDLDHFKEINDTLGHHFGDQLLKEIGPRLSTVLRDNDLMARLGGDEFGVLLPDIPDQRVAVRIAERLMEELEHPITVEGLALDVSGSVGIAIFPSQSEDADTLLRRADVAMYAAKEAGGGYEMYHEEMDRHHPSRLTLIGQVRPAIENSEFVVFYQPKVRLSDGRVAGAEALVRWQHPERGLVPPDEFIPFVEKTVLLRPLTLYVFNEVLKQWRRWADDGIRMPVSVNLSPRSLLDNQLPDQIAELLARWEVPPRFLKVELTESFLMAESGRSAGVLDRLSDIGLGLSIDDFGTGYSSLSHLKRLPIDEIKVDRSFVTHMHQDSNDFMIVRATVELGRNLGLLVVAEGVEDLEAFDRLADFGCDEAQGYYISRPMPADAFTRWLSVRGPEAIVYKDEPLPPQDDDSASASAPANERSRSRLRVT
ncbi:MAG: EAL domain-containing protein [Actinomycetota bacterium]|nr:EAL domain-containing protein [Actinomycetota bacterium]